MKEHEDQDVEELLRDLAEVYGAKEPLTPEAAQLLHELRPGNIFANRRRAVEQLGRLDTSHPRILTSLIELTESDRSHIVRELAAAALRAPARQELLREHPDLQERVMTEKPAAAVASTATRPDPLPSEAVKHLVNLRQGTLQLTRRDAAAALGEVSVRSPRIDRALRTASQSDHSKLVRSAAARALRAREEQKLTLDQATARDAVEEPVAAAGMAPAPAHFRVQSQDGAHHISWRHLLWERVNAGWIGLVFPVAWVVLLQRGANPVVLVLIGVLALASLLGSLAVLVNATTITADLDEWRVRRGPIPMLNDRYYLRTRRLDPSAYRQVQTRVVIEEKERYSSSAGDGIVGLLLDLIFYAVVEWWRSRQSERVTYTLCAGDGRGTELELLPFLSERETIYLKQTLQHLLDAQVLPQAKR